MHSSNALGRRKRRKLFFESLHARALMAVDSAPWLVHTLDNAFDDQMSSDDVQTMVEQSSTAEEVTYQPTATLQIENSSPGLYTLTTGDKLVIELPALSTGSPELNTIAVSYPSDLFVYEVSESPTSAKSQSINQEELSETLTSPEAPAGSNESYIQPQVALAANSPVVVAYQLLESSHDNASNTRVLHATLVPVSEDDDSQAVQSDVLFQTLVFQSQDDGTYALTRSLSPVSDTRIPVVSWFSNSGHVVKNEGNLSGSNGNDQSGSDLSGSDLLGGDSSGGDLSESDSSSGSSPLDLDSGPDDQSLNGQDNDIPDIKVRPTIPPDSGASDSPAPVVGDLSTIQLVKPTNDVPPPKTLSITSERWRTRASNMAGVATVSASTYRTGPATLVSAARSEESEAALDQGTAERLTLFTSEVSKRLDHPRQMARLANSTMLISRAEAERSNTTNMAADEKEISSKAAVDQTQPVNAIEPEHAAQVTATPPRALPSSSEPETVKLISIVSPAGEDQFGGMILALAVEDDLSGVSKRRESKASQTSSDFAWVVDQIAGSPPGMLALVGGALYLINNKPVNRQPPVTTHYGSHSWPA